MKDPEKHQMSTGAMHIGEPHGEMPGGKMEPGPLGGEMPPLTMESMPIKGEMPGGEMGSGQPAGGLQRVPVEIRAPELSYPFDIIGGLI